MDWSRLDPALLPPLVPAGAPLGRVTAGPDRLRGAVLTVAGHDHLAAAYGADAVADGGELESCGTAEAFVRTVPAADVTDDAVERLAGLGVTVGRHVVPDRFALLGATRGGLLLRRVRNLLDPGGDRLAELDAAALAAADDDAGERVTLGDGGVDVLGVGEHSTPGTVWRAALREATGQAVGTHRAISEIAGPARSVTAVGGWTRSAAFMALRAAAIDGVRRSPVTEPGARGAALLAGRAAEAEAAQSGATPELAGRAAEAKAGAEPTGAAPRAGTEARPTSASATDPGETGAASRSGDAEATGSGGPPGSARGIAEERPAAAHRDERAGGAGITQKGVRGE